MLPGNLHAVVLFWFNEAFVLNQLRVDELD
jgi:hypothetical protein